MMKKLPGKKFFLLPCLVVSALSMNAQFSFTNKNTSLHSDAGTLGSNSGVHSGNSVAVVDMNNDGLDDIVKLDENSSVQIEYQQPGGTFTLVQAGDFGITDCWAMVCGDVDRNGYKDVLVGENGAMYLMKINGGGSMGVTTIPSSNFFQQNMNMMDVNGDGWLDIFACDDNSYSKLYLNNGSGSFPAEANNTVINFDITAGQNIGTSNDDSGNYGSVWTDFDNDGDVDLYVAHCRQSVSSGTDERRIDKLYVNNNGTFTEQAATYGVASGDQDWTASFGDIDNDGDFDLFLTKHNTTSRLYTNDGTGHFTVGNSISFGSMPMQAQFEDFDNDGFVDLFITGDNDHRVYRNTGGGNFSDATPTNLTNGSNLLSFASGDLNHDGKIDVYGSYGTTYDNPSSNIADVYWQNNISNNNHFITLVMAPTNSNHDALGVRAFIYGSWGVQTREVRGGESYGTMNSGFLHFGLGSATTIDSVVVNWPSGAHTVITNPVADQFLSVGESNQCTLAGVIVTNSTGNTNLCSGQSTTLSAPAGSGYSYLWSTGATTQAITVNAAGSYAVQVVQSAGCSSTSPAIQITMNANETPSVSTSMANLVFCEGESATLTSSPAASYLWSNGETTQSIVVTQQGNYSVSIQGACQIWTSSATSVTVNPAPAVPTGSDVYLTSPQTVTLTATGSNDVWFDAATGGNQLGTGNTLVTGVISNDTTFYVEDRTSYAGANVNGGMKNHSGSGGGSSANYSSNTINAYLIFDVLDTCVLNSVKVYTDLAGTREIELRNSGGTVLASKVVNIPVDTTVITLNFSLVPGTSYQLGTKSSQNITTIGTNAPRLRRSNNNVTYPYNIAGLCDITNSSQGSNVYYYFFDWNVVKLPTLCPGPRFAESVIFTTSAEQNDIGDFVIYPNPANTVLNVRMKSISKSETEITISDLSGKTISTLTKGPVKNGEVLSVDLNGLSRGVYFIALKQEGKTCVKKLVID
jgi:hypothetical protein